MPLDSINPLMSATGTLGPSWWMPPVPVGDVTAADRKQLVGTYAGFAVDQGSVGSLAVVGVGVAAFDGAFTPGGSLAVIGSEIAAFDGVAQYGGSLAVVGAGIAAFEALASWDASLTVAGDGVAAFDGTSAYVGSLAVVGSGVAAFDGAAEYAGSLAVAGAGLAAFDGQYSLAGSNLFHCGGAGLAAFVGGSEYLASLPAVGSGVAAFDGHEVGESSLAEVGSGVAAFEGLANYDGSLAVACSGVATYDGLVDYSSFLAGVGVGVAAFDGTVSYAGSLAATGSGVARFAGNTPATPDFLSALRARLLEIPELDALADVYLTTSPPAAMMPYMVVNRLYENSSFNTSDAYVRETGMQFTVLSQDASEADTLSAAAFGALLHRDVNPPIVFDGGTEMARFPRSIRGPDADVAGPIGGDLVWRASFDVDFMISVD